MNCLLASPEVSPLRNGRIETGNSGLGAEFHSPILCRIKAPGSTKNILCIAELSDQYKGSPFLHPRRGILLWAELCRSVPFSPFLPVLPVRDPSVSEPEDRAISQRQPASRDSHEAKPFLETPEGHCGSAPPPPHPPPAPPLLTTLHPLWGTKRN